MSALYQFAWSPEHADTDDAEVDMLAALVDAYTSEGGLGRVLGVAQSSIYRWQRGTTPRPETQARIEQLYAHLTAWEPAA